MSSVESSLSEIASVKKTESFDTQVSDDDYLCNDEGYKKGHEDGNDDGFNVGGCKTNILPSIDDFTEQNSCLTQCGTECMIMDSLDDRLVCFSTCTCKGQKFGYEHCRGAGLDVTCRLKGAGGEELIDFKSQEDSEDVQEMIAPEALTNNELTDDQALQEQKTNEEPKEIVETEVLSVIDAMVANDANFASLGIVPETGFEIKDLQNEKALDEFQNLMETDELEKEVRCDSEGWRTCLQMEAPKEKVFTGIKDGGCSYESPDLLLLERGALEKIEEPSYGVGFMLIILFLFLFLYSVATYIYKQECESKSDDFYNENDYEEGYEKLD